MRGHHWLHHLIKLLLVLVAGFHFRFRCLFIVDHFWLEADLQNWWPVSRVVWQSAFKNWTLDFYGHLWPFWMKLAICVWSIYKLKSLKANWSFFSSLKFHFILININFVSLSLSLYLLLFLTLSLSLWRVKGPCIRVSIL